MAAMNYNKESEGDEDEAVGNAIFEILKEYLQPATATTQQQVLDRVAEVSNKWPERAGGRLPGAVDTDDFHFEALLIADQTPYDHPNMHKLASLVVAVINNIDAASCIQPGIGIYSPAHWYDATVGEHWYNSEPFENVREAAFDAAVWSSLEEPIGWHDWTPLHYAFDYSSTKRDAGCLIMAAALCIRYLGHRTYKAAFEFATDEQRNGGTWWQNAQRTLRTMFWKARRVVGCNMTKEERAESQRNATPWRWAKWKKGFVKASRNRRFDAEICCLAAQAAKIMEELELDGRCRPSMESYSTDEIEKGWMN